MPKKFPLQMLLDLAQTHVDGAARNLHQLRQRWSAAEDKLQQLLGYEAEYRARLQNSTSGGMSIGVFRDYQQFLGKLEVAIRQQREEVDASKRLWEEGQREWQKQKRKLNAYDTLSERHRHAQVKVEARTEQRQQDDFAIRRFTSGEKPDEPH
jgi:flagellar FliJ protein